MSDILKKFVSDIERATTTKRVLAIGHALAEDLDERLANSDKLIAELAAENAQLKAIVRAADEMRKHPMRHVEPAFAYDAARKQLKEPL